MTPIDQAHAAMEAAPDDDAARMRFYERVGDAELHLLLEGEADGDKATPQLFEVEGDKYVLAFDRDERLSQFAGDVAPMVTLSGRSLAEMLIGPGLGLGLNIEVAPSAILIPPDAIAWLSETLGNTPNQEEDVPDSFSSPKSLPEELISALDAKLASAQGLAQCAWLAGVTYRSGRHGHILAFVGAEPMAEEALAQAVQEALVFSGLEAGALDVTFIAAESPAVGALAKVGLRFDLPQPVTSAPPAAPGSDPSKPPKL